MSFKYGDILALSDLSLTLSQSGLIGLIGHNGSGKTTLLKILGASLPCQTGNLFMFGDAALNQRRMLKPSLRKFVGVLFQETSSDDKISLCANLDFYGRLMGVSELKSAIELVLERANLVSHANDQVKKLSGGMRRRFELYRAFMHKPKFLILDEPTAGLDFAESVKFLAFARDYVIKNQALILFSSHRATDFESCDVLLMMHKGKIIAQDSPENLLTKSLLWRCHIVYDKGEINNFYSREQLNNLLSSGDLAHDSVRSFSVNGPNLADIYDQTVGLIEA